MSYQFEIQQVSGGVPIAKKDFLNTTLMKVQHYKGSDDIL